MLLVLEDFFKVSVVKKYALNIKAWSLQDDSMGNGASIKSDNRESVWLKERTDFSGFLLTSVYRSCTFPIQQNKQMDFIITKKPGLRYCLVWYKFFLHENLSLDPHLLGKSTMVTFNSNLNVRRAKELKITYA